MLRGKTHNLGLGDDIGLKFGQKVSNILLGKVVKFQFDSPTCLDAVVKKPEGGPNGLFPPPGTAGVKTKFLLIIMKLMTVRKN